jgi:hypothetical protein
MAFIIFQINWCFRAHENLITVSFTKRTTYKAIFLHENRTNRYYPHEKLFSFCKCLIFMPSQNPGTKAQLHENFRVFPQVLQSHLHDLNFPLKISHFPWKFAVN